MPTCSGLIQFRTGVRRSEPKVRIIVFSGGRGSAVISKEFVRDPRVELTLAINGYDDGMSTGEIRRFLGDALGPSDYRKNAARLAATLRTCDEALVDLLEMRLPDPCAQSEGQAFLSVLQGDSKPPTGPFLRRLSELMMAIGLKSRAALALRASAFRKALDQADAPFNFSDCSLGNIVFAGCYLTRGRDFNEALADYCALLGIPVGMVENVTDGSNAHLVAIDGHGGILTSEAEIVDAKRRNRINELFLITHRLSRDEVDHLNKADLKVIQSYFAGCSVQPVLNPCLDQKIREADVIVYAPGTQHSSLFPSYMTPGIGAAIARNLRAFKLLITNLQEDADIAESSAVGIIERAVYYLTEKGRLSTPTPCLITHYLINDPGHFEEREAYLPLGLVDTLEDPRLVRIGNYEDGVTGRHDASRLLQPFIKSFLDTDKPRVAIFLLETTSVNKLSQTVIEMARARFADLGVSADMFYESPGSFDPAFADELPVRLHNTLGETSSSNADFWRGLDHNAFDYVVLFESSGMYKGEDIVTLLSHLLSGRLDAVWGSRRLSVSDIHHAYRLLHRKTPIRGAVSYIGSHVLSLAYLLLYGQYINDTLSGAWAVRTSYLRDHNLHPKQPGVNHRILSELLRDRAQVIEIPVRYFPISPQKVKRTTPTEGLSALWTILKSRLRRRLPAISQPDLQPPQRLFGDLPQASRQPGKP